ncbi:MAG: hypothetical protein H7Z39_20640 [Burkholderiaceae bacterium]|nr:hypothetical protein [Burkholderiaceae bacterium]
MAMTPFPTPVPARTMTQAAFDAAMALHFGALPTFVAEANALQLDVSAKQAATTAAAGAAGESAATATTKAGEASISAGTASAAASTATNKLAAIEALYDMFDDRNLGAHAADPALDNDGNALLDGCFYINTTSGYLRGYTIAGGWVQGVGAVAGVSSLNGQVGAITVDLRPLEDMLFAANF